MDGSTSDRSAVSTRGRRWFERGQRPFWIAIWLVFLIGPALTLPDLDPVAPAVVGLTASVVAYLVLMWSCWDIRPTPTASQLVWLTFVAGLGVALFAAYGALNASWQLVLVYVGAAGVATLSDQRIARAWLAATVAVLLVVGTSHGVPIAAAEEHKPDVALLDIEMPDGSGLDAAEELRARVPSCRVVILTTFSRPGYLRRAMEAGAQGFLVKDAPVEDLAAAIRQAVTGKQIIDPTLAATALSTGTNPLTDREQAALAASIDGATVADVARRLHLAESTVRNYLSAATSKTGTRNRIEAAHAARTNGWL